MKDLMMTEDWYKSLVDDCRAIITGLSKMHILSTSGL